VIKVHKCHTFKDSWESFLYAVCHFGASVSPFSTPFAFASPVTLGLSTLFYNPLQCSLNAISNAIDMTAVLLWPWVSVDFRFCLIMKMGWGFGFAGF